MQISGEGTHSDFKLSYDSSNSRAKLKLVKHLVAMANTGGGEITFGRNETQTPGVNEEIMKALDSAKLADLVASYIKPGSIDLQHEVTTLDNGNYICRVSIGPSRYPLVMSKSGNYPVDGGKQQTEFEPGDIFTRHSSKTEKMSYEDIRNWIERERQEERERLLARITTVVSLPDDAQIQVVSASQTPIDSPKRLLEYATTRRAHDKNHLLSGDDLAYLFANRHLLTVDASELPMIIASALRRNATLYWWLTLADSAPDIIINELHGCLEASDRDKSDAARIIIEMAAIYADDAQVNVVLGKLSSSHYKHFRDAAREWVDRSNQLNGIGKRIINARHQGKLLLDFAADDLEALATALVLELAGKGSSALSRKLGDVTRVIWSRRSVFSSTVTK